MILDIMRSRRSIRQFKPEKPGGKVIEGLIEAAVCAPSADNKQPWRFFVVDDSSVIEEMASSVQKAVDRILTHVEVNFRDAFRAYGDYFIRFRGAPVVIVPAFRELVVLSNLIDSDIAADDFKRIRIMEFNSALISTSLAIQNLMLYAHSQGLGTSCMTGPLVALDELKTILQIPDSWQIAALISVGYPAESPAPTPRKSIESVIRWVGTKTEEDLVKDLKQR